MGAAFMNFATQQANGEELVKPRPAQAQKIAIGEAYFWGAMRPGYCVSTTEGTRTLVWGQPSMDDIPKYRASIKNALAVQGHPVKGKIILTDLDESIMFATEDDVICVCATQEFAIPGDPKSGVVGCSADQCNGCIVCSVPSGQGLGVGNAGPMWLTPARKIREPRN